MIPKSPGRADFAKEEISVLIETLLDTEKRLEELTLGEVDTVAGQDGRTFMLGRAQEQSRHSEMAKQAAILNALAANIALLDNTGVIISVNEAWRRFANANVLHAAGHGIGLNYLDICDTAVGEHADDAHRVGIGIRAVLSGSAPSFSVEYPCHSPTEKRWFLLTANPLTEHQGTGAVVMHLNITGRILAHEALHASLEEFRTLTEAMPQMVWVTRTDGKNTHFNKQWFDYTGLSLEESIGNGWSKPFHPEDQTRAKLAWDQATSDRSTYSIEARIRRADGAYRWWLIRGVPVLDPTENIKNWVGTCTDIDELKQAQTRLGEQAELLDATLEAILVRDLNDRIIFWNKGAERIYGYPASEALGRESALMLHLNPTVFSAALATVLSKGEWQGEVTKRTKAGIDLTVDARWSLVFDAKGRPKSILSINSDITERKKMESQFLRAQRMESIGTLAGGVAHDLNNVLSPILMAVEILKDSVKTEGGLAILATLQRSALHGADLVKQVLSFARGVEGQRIIINPLHIMRDLMSVMRDTFSKSIEVEFRPARNLWTVSGDPTQMHQVLLNLCVNARDAMPGGGKITVTMQNMVLDENYSGMNSNSKPGSYLMVKVEDTGTGIPQDIRDKIFEPFFTTKELGRGTGLGLSTTMAIVRSHGGFITVHSVMGKGTKFTVYFPANTTQAAADEAVAEHNRLPCGNGEVILVVDDEEAIRNIAKRTLERFGYRVLLAGNGAEALAVYATNRQTVALVLTDMAMPIMDGPALIIALKVLNPAVKIIGSSGLTSPGGAAKASRAGVEGFVPKPYSAETILKTIHAVLTGQPVPQFPTSFL